MSKNNGSDDVSDKNIYQRLNAVRQKVAYLQKDKVVAGQGYRAVTHDAVTAAVRPHLIEQGVMVVLRQTASNVVEGTTAKGNPMLRYEARYDIDFVNVDKPDDRVRVTLEAHANDSGDKAPGKAASYATKYAMLKLFNIETGEDEESRVEMEMRAQPITAAQYQALEQLMKETDTDPAAFLRYLNTQPGARLDALTEMRTGLYEFAIQSLNRKKQQKAAGNGSAQQH